MVTATKNEVETLSSVRYPGYVAFTSPSAIARTNVDVICSTIIPPVPINSGMKTLTKLRLRAVLQMLLQFLYTLRPQIASTTKRHVHAIVTGLDGLVGLNLMG